MGHDQNTADPGRLESRVPSTASSIRRNPPPLPPRAPSHDAPPAYSLEDRGGAEMISEQWSSHIPRISSMQSLRPAESQDGRRTLLLIYIHGFMGNETSFQNFPAHLHSLLATTLIESHVVHAKIYPRYKSRRAIEFARDDFSSWYNHFASELP